MRWRYSASAAAPSKYETQTPLSLRHVGTSDRNFYDRAYFNAHDRTGDVFFVAGLGVYPNLGVTDAYGTVRRGDRQWTIRCSDALGHDRLSPTVGPYRVEIQEPLQRIRLICDTADRGLGFDLTWDGSFPAVMEQHHVMHAGARPILDASRFAQVGTWSGTLCVDGDDLSVSPEVWVGTRDRSWGIRPVGEGEPAGRPPDDPTAGLWWLYVPLRFEEFAVVVIVQEQPDGYRTLNDATRVWPDGRVEQLGWPEVEVVYEPGSRIPERATPHLTERGGKPLTVEVASLGYVALGQWRGPGWVESATYDLTDPAVVARIPFGVLDHVGHATLDGADGWGLFEHGTLGRHDPSGFADWDSVAP